MRDLDPTSSAAHLDFTKPYEPEEDKQTRFTRVFERDLFPYSDNGTLLNRLSGSNRLLRHAPELHDQIGAALTADDDESLIGLADDIEIARYLYSPENEKPVNTAFSYLTLLDAISKQALSIDKADGRWNALCNLITKRFTDSFPEDQLEEVTDTIYYLSQRIDQINAKAPSTRLETMKVELLSLAGNMYKRIYSYRYIDLFPDDPGSTVTEEEAHHDTEQIAELFTDIRATQSYGVKMGYIEDPRGGTLIFSPPIDTNEAFAHIRSPHPLLLQDNSVADVTHSRKKRHPHIKIKSHQPIRGLSIVGSTDDLDAILIMSLGKDGELYTDRDCRTPLVDIARAKGKYTAYRDMQARILAHYFDMTHPLDDVRRIQQTIDTSTTNAPTPPESPMESIAKLVIPRTRFHNEHTQTTHATQEDKPKRSVREHGVVWHVRELPEGWHASPSALELAQQLGVKLEANETIVKEHKRGSRLLGEVTTHQFIERPHTDDSEGE